MRGIEGRKAVADKRLGRKLSRRRFLAATAAASLMPSLLLAQNLERRRISFLIGNEGSGGYELYARTFAEHLALALPMARVTIEVVPAADGRLAAKQIAEAPEGQLVIGLFESALLYSEIESDAVAPISLAEYKWIGKMAVDERILIASTKSGITSIEDLVDRKEPVIFPASTVVSRSASECFLLNTMLGLSIKPVAGYNGGQRALAIISGEGQVVMGSYPSQAEFLNNGDAIALLRLNEVTNPSVSTSVPLLRDIAPARYATLIDMLELANNLGPWIAAPPSTTTDDLQALRTAFDRVITSESFLKQAAAHDLAIDPLGGSEVQKLVTSLLSRKEELRKQLADALSCGRLHADGNRSC